jgi:hypothetical protein
MTDFDDFLKKTEKDLKAAREAAGAKANKDKDQTNRLLASLADEWPRLFSLMEAMTANKKIDGRRFYPSPGLSLLLGEASVHLRSGDRGLGAVPTYQAVYKKRAHDDRPTELPIEVVLDGNEVYWKATGTGYKLPVSTEKLAELLVVHLVKIYKDGQIATLK